MLIEGLKLHVSGSEISDHAKKRATYHDKKSSLYAEKASELLHEKAEAIKQRQYQQDNTDQSELALSNKRAESETDGHERKSKQHKTKSQFFTFVSEHVVKDATYVLENNDLIKLEIIEDDGRLW